MNFAAIRIDKRTISIAQCVLWVLMIILFALHHGLHLFSSISSSHSFPDTADYGLHRNYYYKNSVIISFWIQTKMESIFRISDSHDVTFYSRDFGDFVLIFRSFVSSLLFFLCLSSPTAFASEPNVTIAIKLKNLNE